VPSHFGPAKATGTPSGTYRDRLTRTPEWWKIARRVQDYSWKDGNPDVVIR
jgi:hypothetical protein